MSSSKFGRYVLGGAILGAAVSMLDRATRQQVTTTARVSYEKALYYKENPDIVKDEFQGKKEKVQTLIDQVKGDVGYIKSQVDEIKTLTPQVKEMFADTKAAIADSKSEYEQIVEDDSTSAHAASADTDAALPPMVQKKNVIPLEDQ